MPVSVVFETHSITVDNERGVATGWLPGELSERGRDLSRELGRRRADDGIAAVLCSDLARAVQTARIAFADSPVPVLLEGRLREGCFGRCVGEDSAEIDHPDSGLMGGPYSCRGMLQSGAAA